MTLFWSLYVIAALPALFEKTQAQRRAWHPVLWLMPVFFVVMAFREAGGDYSRYLYLFTIVEFMPFGEALGMAEPLYALVNFVSAGLGLGMTGVNAACALVFLYGLYRLAIDEPRPLLVVALAVPYLIIVVAIGYTRQGTAIGLFMLALTQLRRDRPVRYLLLIFLAAGFHTSALIALPLAYFGVRRRPGILNLVQKVGAIGASIGFSLTIASDRLSDYSQFYLESNRYVSQGALIRSLLTAAAGLIFFVVRRSWSRSFGDTHVWNVLALTSLAAVPLSLVQSTATDRIGLFLLPFQILVFERLTVMPASRQVRQLLVAAVLAIYALNLLVWLHFGEFATVLWLPFKNTVLGTFP
jgi:hypothetical protein